ncbi:MULTISPECIES: polysaccharide biosynthesis C-terminal domain-containing protein [Micromonospora]|uniref:Membrane protein involved in the export of O-antigen and teichoic acid n=1 Tax=Micromonospora yangpuensis TaxID=683228 RepID=A0A1C6UGS3_9ACTN|nr:polysaccharide biosynthesis C-terminal domain-containing protein [Micromonospora yangpuensis]GGM04720.1 hypothetical protein GCM10012279_23090 [Micromonospora yangpuensis]SCL53172.1 Membrane protein involved in the export of O-antigen and teichoic acid [Micromonospora yangpuensis]
MSPHHRRGRFRSLGTGQVDPGDRQAPGGVRGQTVVAALASLLGGLLNAGILALSARAGQTGEIAAYTVMLSALAVVTVLLAGGASLLYLTGDDRQRQAVRSHRLLIVLPVMALSAVGVTTVFATRGYGVPALATSAVVAIGNNLGELYLGDLARRLRFGTAAVVTTAPKVAALVLLLTGVPLTMALAVGAVGQLVAGEALVSRGAAGRGPLWHRLSMRSAVAAFGMNRQLMAYNLAEVFTGRAGGVALSTVASPHVVGTYGAVYNVYVALVAVLYQGLRVPMAARVRTRQAAFRNSGGREGEALMVAAAVLAAVGGLYWAPWLSTGLLGLTEPESTHWLQLLAVALPFLTASRAVGLRRIADGDYRAATRLTVLTAGLTGIGLLVLVPTWGPAGAAGATTVAEVLTVGVLVVVAAVRAGPLRRRRPSEPGGVGRHRRSAVGAEHVDQPVRAR